MRRRRDASIRPRAGRGSLGNRALGLSPDPRLAGEWDTAVSHPGAPDRPWETVPRRPARLARELPSWGDCEAGSRPRAQPFLAHTCGYENK